MTIWYFSIFIYRKLFSLIPHAELHNDCPDGVFYVRSLCQVRPMFI
jgi:hypothetical protein